MNDFIRPVSRLPRPVVAGRSRTHPLHLPIVTSECRSSTSLPSIDVGLQNQEHSKRSKRNVDGSFEDHLNTRKSKATVLADQMTSANNYFRSAESRPQTSCLGGKTYGQRRMKSSGKTHLLKKLQTMSLGSAIDRSRHEGSEEVPDLKSASFARFHPLPAIVRPDEANESGENKNERKLLEESGSGYVEYERFLTPDIMETNDKKDAGLQRSATSFFNRRPDSGVTRGGFVNLVRSRTYDVIPTEASTSDNWIIKEEEDDNDTVDNSSEDASQADDLNGHTCIGSEFNLLLAVMRTTSDNEENQLIYGYFNKEDKVQNILDFYRGTTGKTNIDGVQLTYKEVGNDNNEEHRHLDPELTIGESGINNRAVLRVVDIVEPETHVSNEQDVQGNDWKNSVDVVKL